MNIHQIASLSVPLGTARDLHGVQPPPSAHEKLTKQAQIWVSQTFFGELLKQMRQSPFKSNLLSGGRGGEAFAGLYDQQLAQRMARGSGSKLVNAIVRKIEGRAAYERTKATSHK